MVITREEGHDVDEAVCSDLLQFAPELAHLAFDLPFGLAALPLDLSLGFPLGLSVLTLGISLRLALRPPDLSPDIRGVHGCSLLLTR